MSDSYSSRSWSDFQRLMVGSYISMLGSRITTIACPLFVLYVTGSAFMAGLVASAATVPGILFYIPAGALVDRLDPRGTILVCESGRAVAIATVAVTVATGKPSVLLLLAAVFIEETLEVFSTLADQRCIRYLVAPERASSAQAKIEARTHAVVLAGRPLGTLLFSIAPALPFLTDALTFAGSLLGIISLKTRNLMHSGTGHISGRQLGSDILEGLRWIWKDSYARGAMILSGGTTLIGQALIMIFLAQAHDSRLPPLTVSFVLAASGVGGILGSVISARLRSSSEKSAPTRTPGAVPLFGIQLAAWSGALAILALVGARSVVCMALVMAALSLTGAFGNIEISTYLIQKTNEKMLGRATSIGRLTALSACAAGPMTGGILIQLLGARYAIFMLFLTTLPLAAFAFLIQPPPPLDNEPNRPPAEQSATAAA